MICLPLVESSLMRLSYFKLEGITLLDCPVRNSQLFWATPVWASSSHVEHAFREEPRFIPRWHCLRKAVVGSVNRWRDSDRVCVPKP